jgi:HK97 family phage major capsid protein
MKTEFLIRKRESLTATATELRERIAKDERAFTAEERQQFDDAIAEIRGIDDTLKSIDAALQADVAAAQTAQASRSAVPGQVEQAVAAPEARGLKSAAYAQAFVRYLRGDSHSAVAELRAHQVATDTSGGHLVPDEWYAMIVRKLRELNYMRQYATVISTSRGDLNIPRETSTGTAAWTGEGIGFNESEDVFGNVSLTPYKMTRLVKASEELLTDEAYDLMGYLVNTFASSFADLEEAAFVNGDGSSKPTGVIRSSTTGVTAAATNAITFDEVSSLYYSLKPAYRANAVWMMNDATRKTLSQIKTGVASDLRYLWTENVAGGPPATLFGRPVISASNMPTIATGTNVVAFGDLSYYYVADKPGLAVQRLNELYSASGLVGFRAFRRTDGELIQAEAVKHIRTA